MKNHYSSSFQDRARTIPRAHILKYGPNLALLAYAYGRRCLNMCMECQSKYFEGLKYVHYASYSSKMFSKYTLKVAFF